MRMSREKCRKMKLFRGKSRWAQPLNGEISAGRRKDARQPRNGSGEKKAAGAGAQRTPGRAAARGSHLPRPKAGRPKRGADEHPPKKIFGVRVKPPHFKSGPAGGVTACATQAGAAPARGVVSKLVEPGIEVGRFQSAQVGDKLMMVEPEGRSPALAGAPIGPASMTDQRSRGIEGQSRPGRDVGAIAAHPD